MPGSAEAYRDQAREIAALAERAEDLTVRAELLALAERFWRLAEYVDTHSPGAAFSPLGLPSSGRR